MSLASRKGLVAHPSTLFQPQVPRSDLLDPTKTTDNHIEALWHLVQHGLFLEFTMIRTGHHPDGPNGHNPGGKCSDFWLNSAPHLGAWLDGDSHEFRAGLYVIRDAPHIRQVGLGGTAWNDANVAIVGGLGFPRDGSQDHVHFGVS